MLIFNRNKNIKLIIEDVPCIDFSKELKQPFYFRYMDDVICTINKDKINDRLKTINNLHPGLTFTHKLLIIVDYVYLCFQHCFM